MTLNIYQQFIDALLQGITPAQLVESDREIGKLPSLPTFYKYVNADNARITEYALARERCADTMADQVVVVSDSSLDPARAANRMKSRQWWASKSKPKTYGDKLDIDVTGKIDVQSAIIAARKRAQLIDITPQSDATTSDTQSDAVTLDNEPIDPFS